jgi:hypothetical protein
MNVRPFIVAAALGVAACSPTPPGPQPNSTYFWLVTSSAVMFNDYCSDDPTFRMMNAPLAFMDNSYIIYKGSADAKKATLMTCTALDPSTCTPSTSGIVFDVAGSELSYQTESKALIGTTMCNQQDDTVWLLTDHVQTLDVQISDTISLVDSTTDCARIEMDAEARSPNHKGYQGCTITFVIGASAR